MKINYFELDGVCVIRLKGIVSNEELYQVECIIQETLKKGVTYFVINMVDVTDLSSAGMGKLYEIQWAIQAKHGQLFLCDLSAVAAYVLELSDMTKQFIVYGTEDQAVNVLRRYELAV